MSAIGIWICDCAGVIADKIDTKILAHRAQALNNVTLVKQVDMLCSKQGLQEMQRELTCRNIEKIVMVGCSPRTSLKFPEEKITCMLEQSGRDPDWFEVANIREQVAWLSESKEEATNCALDLMAMAHARLEHAQSATRKVPLAQNSLVIGGGPAGLQAAKDLAAMNQRVSLIERRSYLGGKVCQFPFLFQCEGWPAYCTSLCLGPVQAREAVVDANITPYLQAEVANIDKREGNFVATIEQKAQFVDADKCISCGKCALVCPESTFSFYNSGLFKRKAIDKEFERAVPDCYSIIDSACTRCNKCVEVCPTAAIDLQAQPRTVTENFGAVFVASGFDLYDLQNNEEYNNQALQDVVSSIEFERIMANGGTRPSDGKEPESVVFVLCAGSRAGEEKNGSGVAYCSKTCCSIAVKQAERLAMANQMAEITILYYRDIRAYGRAAQSLYTKVRDMGIEFVNGEVLSITTDADDTLQLKVAAIAENELAEAGEEQLQTLQADLVVLSHAQIPERQTTNILQQLGVSLDKYDFPIENQPRIFRPTESFVDRVYIIGSAVGPKVVQQAVEQGSAAVTKALPLLMSGEKKLSKFHSVIHSQECSQCRICESVCPHGAIRIGPEGVTSDPAFCQACGLCQASCPTHAVSLTNFTDKQILEQAAVGFANVAEDAPKILALLCYWCAYAGADLAGVKGMRMPLNFRSIRIRCSSSVKTGLLMQLLKMGIDGILIAGCPHKSCHHRWGNYLSDKRTTLLRALLKQMGLSDQRVRFEYIGVPQSQLFVKTIGNMDKALRKLGSNPLPTLTHAPHSHGGMA